MNKPAYTVCVAPMMDWTDRHCRYFLRLISKHTLLYTEMVVAEALLHADPDRFLAHDPAEAPLALQLGGSDPESLSRAAALGQQFGYDEINLNVGCPSDRVQSGRFGACLMDEPDLVADCVTAMRDTVSVPVTVKTRIGIDDRDDYKYLHDFVATVVDAGCKRFIVHARKAILKGLSPKQNREIPPLDYSMAARLKSDFGGLAIILNGGIKSIEDLTRHLDAFDGVMIGREAYSNPYLLAEVDQRIYKDASTTQSRFEILSAYETYVTKQLESGVPLNRMLRHVLGLFQGCQGARNWRRHLSENANLPGGSAALLQVAREFVQLA
ncbi:MAG: tRNA dihydrouridine(20/20a) synthase DusA [Gammaproteobacteria bacterium]